MQEANATFDGLIPEIYDKHLGAVLFEPYAADLVDRLKPRGPKDVLELACGTGIVTRALLDGLKPRPRLVATDLNEPMIAYARSKVGGEPGLEWRQADASALPFPDASFDAVVCQFGIMFVPDKLEAMKEARRVLRPGGVFAFNVWDKIEENDLGRTAHEVITRFFPFDPPQFYMIPFGFHDSALIRSMLGQAGFAGVQIESVGMESRSPSARHVAVGLVRGNPVVNAIQERGGVEVGTVIAAVEEALRRPYGDSPLKARMRAWVVMASPGSGKK
ncbi:MAG TPA: methyltransferase domain-containing protein [Candidatus Dormibacteraeota bacterium]|nr:methyltransferase domain-containing protein [Candidatus Dormibacteraeota bacterium]